MLVSEDGRCQGVNEMTTKEQSGDIFVTFLSERMLMFNVRFAVFPEEARLEGIDEAISRSVCEAHGTRRS